MKIHFSKHKHIYCLLGIFLLNIFTVLHTQIISNTNYAGSKVDVLLYHSSPYLIAMDILCIVGIFLLHKSLQRIFFTANIALCAFIGTYIHILKQPPTLTAIYNGIHNTKDLSLTPYLSYEIIAVTLGIILLINLLLTWVKPYSVSKKYLLFIAATIFALHAVLLAQKPFVGYREKSPDISQNIRSSIQLRGNIATFFLEWQSGLYKKGAEAFSLEQVAPSRDLSHLPPLSAQNNIVIIQVECLGYELLQEKVQQRWVMPFLHALQDSSVVLQLEGIKLLGSANTDYEIFTTRKASQDFMAYDFVSDFSGNIVENLAQKGFTTRMFHNAYGDYMNLRSAYTLMGFEQRHFSEELRKGGYSPLAAWKGKLFSDRDLFDFVQKNPPQRQKNFDFIITISMHEPSYTKGSENPFASSPHADFFKACLDTDTALAQYYATLPEGTLLIIYGDHSSYFGNTTPFTAFMAHIKGKNISYKDTEHTYLRTDISHYLRSIHLAQ